MLFGYADTLMQLDRLDESATIFEKGLLIDPKSTLGLSYYADLLRTMGKLDEAAAKFKKSLSIVPDDPYALSRYADRFTSTSQIR